MPKSKAPKKARAEDPLSDTSEQIAIVTAALEAYDFKARTDIVSLTDIRMSIRDMFIDVSTDVPFPFEELAALAVIGIAKDL